MRSPLWLAMLVAVMFSGCDPRVSEEYRGEPLFSVSGSLMIDTDHDWNNLVPVIAFRDPSREQVFPILDVETRGSFQRNFTVDLMLPPPAAAMVKVPGMPSFAAGVITALPKDHPSEFVPPVEDPYFPSRVESQRCDAMACYEDLRICIRAGECYARKQSCPPDGSGECEILQSLGDPSFIEQYDAYALAYERAHERSDSGFLVLYVDNDGPLDSTRGYAHHPYGRLMSAVFGKGPITAGYQLVRMGPVPEAEWPAVKECQDTASSVAALRVATAHAQEIANTDWDALIAMFNRMNSLLYEHPYFKEYIYEYENETYEHDCMGAKAERIDSNVTKVAITLDYRDLNFF